MIKITNKNFRERVIKNKKPVMIEFWAPWCSVCQMVRPIIEKLAKEFTGKVDFGEINVDENSALSDEYKVTAIPTLFFFKNGKIVDQTIGLESKEKLTQKLNYLIK